MKWVIILSLNVLLVTAYKGFGPGEQKWGHVKIREHANLFYWILYTTADVKYANERPLIVWLQGGPGASSTGFGNFAEIGPLDTHLKPRNSTWVQHANILFLDSPVGTGFSYVEKPAALTKNNREIAEDFSRFMKIFYKENPEFNKVPLYIFSESYGGKMTAEIALVLHEANKNGSLKTNLKGIGLGDSWISPIDSVLTWAPYLLHIGAIDESGYNEIETMANKTKEALDNLHFSEATHLWGLTEQTISVVTHGINFYNILAKVTHESMDSRAVFKPTMQLRADEEDRIKSIMNQVRAHLNISNEWGKQSHNVFSTLKGDFMKPATHIVEKLLNDTNIKIAVFNGQLDLIVDTPGTVKWVDNLNWKNSYNWKIADRLPLSVDNSYEGYIKKSGNFAFYWVNRAGHMVPSENPAAMEFILKEVTDNFIV